MSRAIWKRRKILNVSGRHCFGLAFVVLDLRYLLQLVKRSGWRYLGYHVLCEIKRLLSVLIIGVLSRSLHRVPLRLLPVLGLLAILDTGAFAFVTSAGHFSNPEYGTVASSISGIFAIILG